MQEQDYTDNSNQAEFQPENHIDVVGAGFVPGVPGIHGNNKVTKEGVVVSPVVSTPETPATPDAPATAGEQPKLSTDKSE